MADNFGLKIGVEGEKEFKRALSDINQSFKVLGSEMKLVESEFGKNESSVQSLTAKNEVLTKQIDAQKDKIETLQKALKNASDSFGENDRRTQNWAVQLNNAKAELNGMERELEQSAAEADKLGDELKKSGNEAENSGGKFDKLGGILKGVGAAMGTVALVAGAAAFNLGKEVVQQFGELEQNLGGSEAVFGEYAASIQKPARMRIKTLVYRKAIIWRLPIRWAHSFKAPDLNSKRALSSLKRPCSGLRIWPRSWASICQLPWSPWQVRQRATSP